MTEQELQMFKELFGKYCQREINNGYCETDSCEFCPVNNAYEEIFDRFADDKDDESDE